MDSVSITDWIGDPFSSGVKEEKPMEVTHMQNCSFRCRLITGFTACLATGAAVYLTLWSQEAYAKAPAVTRDRMYLETMQQIFANTTKVMVDAKNGSNLLYLPLDKLIQQSASDAAPTSGKAPASSAVQPSAGTASTTSTAGNDTVYSSELMRDSRNRDPRDARDREVR